MAARGEFGLIDDFARAFRLRRAPLGPGDDCAVLPPTRGALCVTTDAVVEGVHFTRGHFSLEDVGHKALAVNLSDLAAMGAAPRWFLCALALPAGTSSSDVRALGRGMAPLAREHGAALAGGNVTRAKELSLTLTAAGEVPRGKALLRGGGRPGDVLFVSGTLGDARLGLACLGMKRAPDAQRRQRRPLPRLRLGLLARAYASACIDVSDGLAGDLKHLCDASAVGARVDVDLLPSSAELRAVAGVDAWRWALAGGEDYELLLAVPLTKAREFQRAAGRAGQRVTRIGELRRERGLAFSGGDGRALKAPGGFDHFRAS